MRSTVKVMLTVFFGSCGVVNQEYASQGHNTTIECSLEGIRRICDVVKKTTASASNRKLAVSSCQRTRLFFVSDSNFLGRTQHSVKHRMSVSGSMLYQHGSLWLVAAFQAVENGSDLSRVKWIGFESRQGIMQTATVQQYSILLSTEKYYQQWIKCGEKCLQSKGEYCEGD